MQIEPGQLGRWYDAWSGGLVLYARARWGSAAEDVVQEAFVKLMKLAEAPEHPKAWLYRCVHNAAISRVRKELVRRKHLVRLGERAAGWFTARPEDAVDAGAAQAALGELDKASREVVVLRIWGQMSWREIAEITGMPTSTAHHRYGEALAEMKRRIEKCGTNTRS